MPSRFDYFLRSLAPLGTAAFRAKVLGQQYTDDRAERLRRAALEQSLLAQRQTEFQADQDWRGFQRERLEREMGWAADPTTSPAYQAYRDAGMSDPQARAAVLTPSLADNFLRAPPAPERPLVRDQIRERIQALVTGGMPLEQASHQARREFGYTVPRPGGAAGASPITAARRNLPIYERGVREAQAAVTATERALPRRPAFGFTVPEAEQRFRTDSASRAGSHAQALAALQRAKAARDSVAADVTGALPPATPASPERPPTTADDLVAMRAELRDAFARRQRLLDGGVDPTEVDRAYQATVQQILRRYGQS
jgi:hypothetical protein